MERDQAKKKGNKRNNVDKFNESIGPLKKTKDKMKSEKSTPLSGVGVDVKMEPNLDVEFKKEPGFDNSLCDNESKNSLNMCSKPNDAKNMKPGMMDLGNIVKMQDRPFIDPKSEMTPHSEGNTEEEDLQSNLLPSDIKTENVSGDGNIFPPDSNENLILGLVNQTPTSGPGGVVEQGGSQLQPGVQPLPSNVINKQPGTMEAQYMQQQSQIFVFSTALANKAADAVIGGRYTTIIQFHCDQPGTKKYLEKNPLKLNQFNRQGPAQWLNSMSQMKQKTGFPANSHMKNINQMPRPMVGGMGPGPCEMGNNSPNLGPGPGPRPLGPNMVGPMGDLEGMPDSNDLPGDFGKNMHPMNMWNQGNMNQNNMPCQGPMKPMDRDKPCGLNRPPMMENLNPNNFPGVSQITLTGTQVPTENLTPQQRQHREEQLATLSRMKQILFPEKAAQPTDEFGNPRMGPGVGTVNVTQNTDGNPGDTNDVKSQIGLKSVNNNSNNLNSPMGRNMNGQSGNSGPMDSPMGFNNMVNPLVNPNNNNNSNNNASNNNNNNNNSSSNVMDASENSHAMQEQNSQMMQKNNFPPDVNAQMTWQKMCQVHVEEKKKKGSRTDSPVPRGCNKMQGPPPPYHQTVRSASVPIAVPSPNPGSPSNQTSNLSLPSPRTSSDLNSPSDVNKLSSSGGNSMKLNTCSPPNNQGSPACSKLMVNNPETPVSTSASQSPTPSSRKDAPQSGLDFNNKDLFSRTTSSLTQQKHHKQQNSTPNKEPNLMPVPSPQQIQYLNAFEGQELTIQKQPNTSLKESNMNSPLNHAPLAETPKCKTAANSPLPQSNDNSPRFPNLGTSTSTTCTTPVSTQSQNSVPVSKDATTVPSSPDTSGPSPCKSNDLPLNPNTVNCAPNSKSMHFDPITSLAQMSQQLTNQSTPPCPGTGPMMSFNASSMHMMGNMNHMEPQVGPVGGPVGPMGHDNQNMESMPFVQNNPIISCAGPMMDMNPGFLNTSSPKPNMGNPAACRVGQFFGGPGGFPRMMGPGPGPGPGPNSYDGMNVQVKASTPNTIQYLPARGNTNSNPNPRGPPSLDFLPRFPHPMNNMNAKVPFIPNNCNSMDVNAGNNGGMNCGGPVGNSGGNMMSGPVPNMLLGGNMVMNPGGGPMGPLRGQIRPGPGGMMKMPPMGGGSPVFPPGPNCDPMGMGPGGNPNMFIQGSKSSPLGMPPDASQPLPPSMSQGSNFKNSPFVGPTPSSDPNYAQQFHNFQQQLYATNTRNHQMNSHMNQSYFMPK